MILTKNKLKELKKLKQKKFRANSQHIIIEGKRIIEQIIAYGVKPDFIFIDETKVEAKASIPKKMRSLIEYVPEHVVRQLSDTISPQEIVAVFSKPHLTFPSKGNFLYFDNIRDPGNMGTIFRTAIALGIDGVIISPDSCEIFSPKVVRSSLGAIFKLPILVRPLASFDIDECDIISTEMAGTSMYDVELTNPNTIIIIGNEANGVSKEISELSNLKISIPMNDQMESLNASVAASIVSYHLMWKKYGNKFTNR